MIGDKATIIASKDDATDTTGTQHANESFGHKQGITENTSITIVGSPGEGVRESHLTLLQQPFERPAWAAQSHIVELTPRRFEPLRGCRESQD